MTVAWVRWVVEAQNAALLLSLLWNVVLSAAVWRLWRSRETLQDRVTTMLADLTRELARLTERLAAGK